MQIFSKLIGLAAAASVITGCSKLSPKAETHYKDMTTAEQAIELQKYVEKFNAVERQANAQKQTKIAVVHHGDPKTHIIYAVGTFPTRVSARKLAHARKALAKIKAQENLCNQPEMIEITNMGIGYQAIMKDLSGKTLYESEVCQSETTIAAL